MPTTLDLQVHTPFDHTKDFELKLGTAQAIPTEELHKYELNYHGEYRHSIGQLIHIQQ